MARNTAQRRAIRQALVDADRPLSPREVLDAAQQQVTGLGIATVYRNIKALVEDGWLAPVELPGEPPRYEVAGKSHHHHFVCRGCDRVYELSGCPGDLASVVPSGFQLDSHEVVLYGRCAACAGTAPK
jgi:Fur family transcriptional regulator, ferric uptake regulator